MKIFRINPTTNEAEENLIILSLFQKSLLCISKHSGLSNTLKI